MHMLRFAGFAVVLLGGAYVAALADAPRPGQMPKPGAAPMNVMTYGKENSDCAEWTNSCQVCTRDDQDAPQCSTPGIACTPGAMVCRVKKPGK